MEDYDWITPRRWKLYPEPPKLDDLEKILYHRMDLCSSLSVTSSVLSNQLGGPQQRYASHHGVLKAVSCICFSPDGVLLAVTNGLGDLSLLDTTRQKTWRMIPKAVGETASITSMVFTGERKLVASDDKGVLTLFDVRNTKEPLNALKTDSDHIQSIRQSSKCNWLISADLSGSIQYHSLSALEVRGAELERDLHFGALFHCPLLNHLAISRDESKMALTCRNNSSIYLIDNLDFPSLANDLRSIRFDNSLKMYLMMSPSSGLRRNNITIMDQDEFIPEPYLSVTKFSQLQFLPNSQSLLLKMTTRERSLLGTLNRDWLGIVWAKESDDKLYRSIGSSSAFEDYLLFVHEEQRYLTLTDKRADITSNCNLVSSPHKDGVQLLSFSQRLQSLHEITSRNPGGKDVMDMFLPQQNCTERMSSLKLMQGSGRQSLYCNFSPIMNTLLAVGDSEGFVSFFQPKL